MKEIKKESLKIFSKDNLKNLIFIIFIKATINFLLIFLAFLIIFSLTDYKLSSNNLFYMLLYPLALVQNLNFLPIIPILVSTFLYAVIVYAPLQMGSYLWFSQIKKDSKTSLLTVFYYYKNSKFFLKSILFSISIWLSTILNFIFCFVPTISTFIFVCLNVNNFADEFQIFYRILILFSFITIFIGAFFFVKLQISQIFTKFVFVQNPSEKNFTIFKSSRFLLHNNNKDLRKFLRSFWSLLILCFFLLPIPFVWAYFKICSHEFTKKITYKQNQGIVAIPLTQKVIDINL